MTSGPKPPRPPLKRAAPPELGLQRQEGPPSDLDSQRFLRALEFAMRWEQDGGPDQATRYGITQSFHDTHGDPSHAAGVSHIQPQESRQLYHALWQRLGSRPGAPLDFPSQLATFDTAVNRGENSPSLKLPLEQMLAQRVTAASPRYRQGITNRVGDLWTEIAKMR